MLPDFIIIGAMKCGTTSLYDYLNIHPEIGMSARKEVDYFIKENNFNKGIGWYQSQFQGKFVKYGEASPNYSKAHYFRGVPRRIYDLIPSVKLVYLVRNPIERIISHYTHNYSEGRENKPLKRALKPLTGNHYVMCSRYFWQLEHYLEYFSPRQVLVVPSYCLKKRRRPTLRRIFRFLGVDDSFYSKAYHKESHQTTQKRRKGRMSRAILESPFIKSVKGYIPDTLKEPIKKMTRSVVKKPVAQPVLKEKLQDLLRNDIKALESFSKEPLTNKWKL